MTDEHKRLVCEAGHRVGEALEAAMVVAATVGATPDLCLFSLIAKIWNGLIFHDLNELRPAADVINDCVRRLEQERPDESIGEWFQRQFEGLDHA